MRPLDAGDAPLLNDARALGPHRRPAPTHNRQEERDDRRATPPVRRTRLHGSPQRPAHGPTPGATAGRSPADGTAAVGRSRTAAEAAEAAEAPPPRAQLDDG